VERTGKFSRQSNSSSKVNALAELCYEHTKRDCHVRFHYAGWFEEYNISILRDEADRSEFINQTLINGWVRLEIKLRKAFQIWKTVELQTHLDPHAVLLFELAVEQTVWEMRIAPIFSCRLLTDRIGMTFGSR
jgi:hypothetical protein